LRFAEKSSNEEAQTILFSIADEEKVHFCSLGDLMDKKI
jgi:rubrerythrin